MIFTTIPETVNTWRPAPRICSDFIEPSKNRFDQSGQAGFPQEFLDWPTADNPKAQHAGTHAIFVIAVERVVEIADALGNEEVKADASALLAELRAFIPDNVGNKQAAALMALAGLEDPAKPNVAVVAKNGGENFSTFYGYYMLKRSPWERRSASIREYWGAMLDVGATTFWEISISNGFERRPDRRVDPGRKESPR